MSEIRKLGIKDLQSGLKNKEFSSVEITQEFINQIKQDELNSFVLTAEDFALEQAKAADQKIAKGEISALTGIPVAFKDLILTKGIKTTACSKMLADFIPPYDSTVTKKVYEAGGIMIGKTNMDEFAMGGSNENSCFGPVKNPWDKSRVSGGSSGGSAVAVANGYSPVSLGSDTGGSIRQPASFCGIYGIKPTYGRVSRYGIIAFASSLDQIGTFAKNTEDLATMLEVISGKDPLDATSVDMPNNKINLGTSIKGLKIGVPKEYFIEGLDPEIESTVKKAIAEYEKLGAEIVEISLPHTEQAVSTYYIIAPAEASSNLSRYDGIRYGFRDKEQKELKDLYSYSRSKGFGEEVKRRILIGSYVLSSGYYDAYYLHAQKVRTLIAQDFKAAFEKVDLIACPTAPTTAFKIGENISDPVAMYLCDVFTIPASLAGLPGMSHPCGFDSKGLPIGLQLLGRPWEEEKLLNASYAYQQNTEWHKKLAY